MRTKASTRKMERLVSRIEFRTTPTIKESIQKAASLSGSDLSGFISRTLSEKAQEIISKAEILELSSRDRDIFLEALSNPPIPNEALKKAASRYKNTK